MTSREFQLELTAAFGAYRDALLSLDIAEEQREAAKQRLAEAEARLRYLARKDHEVAR